MSSAHKSSPFFKIHTILEAREQVFPHLYMFITVLSAVDTKVSLVLNATQKTLPVNLMAKNMANCLREKIQKKRKVI